MGLDMYLLDKDYNEVGYWRKANQIHKWFVDNVQNGIDDCGYYNVSVEQLKELLGICKEIKNNVILEDGKVYNSERYQNGKCEIIYVDGKLIKNTEICEKLLPTQSGFFFGHYDYDEYYLDDINNTIEILTKAIKEFSDKPLQYHSSW